MKWVYNITDNEQDSLFLQWYDNVNYCFSYSLKYAHRKNPILIIVRKPLFIFSCLSCFLVYKQNAIFKPRLTSSTDCIYIYQTHMAYITIKKWKHFVTLHLILTCNSRNQRWSALDRLSFPFTGTHKCFVPLYRFHDACH